MHHRTMRLIRISAAVFVFDQLSKGLADRILPSGHPIRLIPSLHLDLSHAVIAPFLPDAYPGDWPRWALLIGVLALIGLVLWITRREDETEGYSLDALYLVTGGVLGNATDLLLFGHIVNFLTLTLGTALVLPFNGADVAIAGGVLLFIYDEFARYRIPSTPLYPVRQPESAQIRFERLIRGIDNVHIDACLSPEFTAQSRKIISSMLAHEVFRNQWDEKYPGPTKQDFEGFSASYARMLDATIHRAKQEGRIEMVQLMQFTVIKLLIKEVQSELDSILRSLKASMKKGHYKTGNNTLEVYEHIVWLAKNRPSIQYRVNHQLFHHLHKVEVGPAASLRQSLLGTKWPAPKEILFNPLLQGATPQDDEIMMKHYVLLGRRVEDQQSFTRIESLIQKIFQHSVPHPIADYPDRRETAPAREQTREGYPVALEDPDNDTADGATKAEPEEEGFDVDGLEQRRLLDSSDWAVVPENVDILLNTGLFHEHLQKALGQQDYESIGTLKAHLRFQAWQMRVLEKRFKESGLLYKVIAAYEMLPLARDYGKELNPQLIHQFLSGGEGARHALLKIKMMQRITNKPIPLAPLQAAARRIRRASRRQRHDYLLRFIKDMVTYRRDLKNYYIAKDLMEQIRLLDSPDDIRLSSTNNTLYEFLAPDEVKHPKRSVRRHAIIKADLRGSSTITRELLRRGLNPASHFSLNFFGPIDDLIKTFGAEKVFVEGDAIILCVIEQDEVFLPRLCVSRACGLAKNILDIVYVHNKISKKHGLPELELGIGIAFCDEPPTYLFDGDIQIMISPAIARTDRLSSCAWSLRQEKEYFASRRTRVAVYELPEGDPMRGEKGEIDLRYNVDGVELDCTGFEKLKTEISLHRIEKNLPGQDGACAFYVGRYPDAKGGMHWLVLRERPVRLFNRAALNASAPTPRFFYEILVENALIDQLTDLARETEPAPDYYLSSDT